MDTKALRQKVLDLAIRGKLVPQDPNDEPADLLLERIRQQKQQMVKEGKLKAKDIKNDTVIFVGEDNLHYATGKKEKILCFFGFRNTICCEYKEAVNYLYFRHLKIHFSNGVCLT